MSQYRPPFLVTSKILEHCVQISRELGRLDGQKLTKPTAVLRRSNQIKTIQASLAIEGNTLDLEQVTDLLAGKRVLGPSRDILEVKNACEVYHKLQHLNPLNLNHLLQAHGLLMKDLVSDAGQFRDKGVGIFKGSNVAHVAPPAKRVPVLMENLFAFLKVKHEHSWLLKSCVFHYEFEFIHPFSDGNGRMGRLWQQLLLIREHPVFEYVSVERIIKANQEEYYESLAVSDRKGDSTVFIEFSLGSILQALLAYGSEASYRPHDARSRLQFVVDKLSSRWFKRKEYCEVQGNISMATASRDLLFGVENQILRSRGTKNQVEYWFN